MTMTGRALSLPARVSNEELLATQYVSQAPDVELFAAHVLESIVPNFRTRVSAGDIIIGGANFAAGNLHAHGFMALRRLGLGLICESMSKRILRLAINSGLPLLPNSPGALTIASDGDVLEVDFVTGAVVNRSRGMSYSFEPLRGVWRDVMLAGGGVQYAVRQIAQ